MAEKLLGSARAVIEGYGASSAGDTVASRLSWYVSLGEYLTLLSTSDLSVSS